MPSASAPANMGARQSKLADRSLALTRRTCVRIERKIQLPLFGTRATVSSRPSSTLIKFLWSAMLVAIIILAAARVLAGDLSRANTGGTADITAAVSMQAEKA